MGTSRRHTPTVVGEPNWGKASAAVTSIAGAEEKLDEIEKELEEIVVEDDSDEQEDDEQKSPVKPTPPAKTIKRQQQLDRQILRNYHKAVRSLVRAAGGRNKVSTGGSRAIGHAGIVIAGELISAINDIVKNGLSDWLNRRGVTSLEGKCCQDVLDLLKEYIAAGVAGLDNTAANEALECMMDDLGEKIGEDLEDFDSAMAGILASNDLKELLDKFFGMYIFSHLSQDFKERLEYKKGTKVMNETMNEIKELIMDDIHRNRDVKDASTIDWSAEEGKSFIQQEFDRIIYILSGNED